MKTLLCTFWILMTATALYSQTLEDDRLALVALYNSTNGAGWLTKTGWDVPGNPGDSPCGWYGVTCSGSPSRVTQITIYDNNMVGPIPSEISNLTELRYLALSGNKLSGSIPVAISSLSKLEYLWLGMNELSGAIPSELGNLPVLKEIVLDNNDLSGTIPASLAGIPTLTQLYLNLNHLTGSIPTALTTAPLLVSLALDNNELSGTIPDFSVAPSLSELTLNNNKFTFNGMEGNNSGFLSYYTYANQAEIPLYYSGGTFSVTPGGTLANLTFVWYKGALPVATIVGSPTYTPASVDYTKNYSVRITNSLLPSITLRSVAVLPADALPVRLVSFSARLDTKKGAILSWSTASESNCKGFEIHRSSDAVNYETVGFREGAGTTSELKSYTYVDQTIRESSYYRIKQIDFDGSSTTGPWKLVRFSESDFSIYPNPAVRGEEVTVQLPEGFQHYDLTNSRGEFVRSGSYQDKLGGKLQLKQLEPGMYILNAVTTTGVESKKLIIQ